MVNCDIGDEYRRERRSRGIWPPWDDLSPRRKAELESMFESIPPGERSLICCAHKGDNPPCATARCATCNLEMCAECAEEPCPGCRELDRVPILVAEVIGEESEAEDAEDRAERERWEWADYRCDLARGN